MMLRNGRIARRVRDWVGERRMAPAERRAAQIERAVERRLRRERDKDRSATSRDETFEAERRRHESILGHRP